MVLDSSAREANVKDSIKKFFVDNLHTIEDIKLTFDKGLASPKIQGREVDRWVAISFGSMIVGTLSEHSIDVFLCTKMDNEGFKLAQLRDTVMGYFSDTSATDGMKRITLWRSHRTDPWTNIGALLITEIIESDHFTTDDETKYKILSLRLQWAAKI